MARAKRKSDEVYNARRRAKRLMARMAKEDTSGMSAQQKAARLDYMRSVQEQVVKSYDTSRKQSNEVSRQQARESAAKAASRLDKMTAAPRAAKTAVDRSNLMFKRQLNLARIGAPSTLGKHGEQAVTIFYAATKKIWRGKNPAKRNELIMKALGAETIEEAYKLVLSKNVGAFRALVSYAGGDTSYVAGFTDENEDFYNEVSVDPELLGSPVWASFLSFIG